MRIQFETDIIPGLLNTAKFSGYKLESIVVFVLRFKSSGSVLENMINSPQADHAQAN